MSITITKHNVDQFILKASIYTTGGGLDVESQLENVASFRDEVQVPIVKPAELDAHSYVCSVTEIGGLGAPPLPKQYTIPLMLKELQRISGKTVAGFFPPEIGQESIVLESAHYAGVPIVDFDPVGFRAVPFVDISVFLMENADKLFTPAVALTDRGDIISIPEDYTYEKAEKKLRSMTSLSKFGCILVLGEITSVQDLQKFTKDQVHSYHSIMQSNNSHTKTNLKMHCTVTSVQEFEHTGFDCKVIKLNHSFSLCILNEAIFVIDKQHNIVSSVPERILLLNTEETQGISTDSLVLGSEFVLKVIPPEPVWSSAKGRHMFGRERFRFFEKYLD